MNPGLYPDYSSQAQGSVKTPVQWTSGSTGAVPALSAFAFREGIKSVTRDTLGIFTIVFQNAAAGFIGMSETIVQASYSAAGACHAVITSNNIKDPDLHSITINTVKADGTVVDPTTNDVIALVFDLQWVNAR